MVDWGTEEVFFPPYLLFSEVQQVAWGYVDMVLGNMK